MEAKLEQEIKNYLHSAVQSGKAETSGLVMEILRKLDNGIEVSVKRHVNGNIAVIKKSLDDYIESDNKWKAKYEPYIESLANLSASAKLLIWIAGGITTISAAIIAIKSLLK